MKLVAISRVYNEADIIEAFVRHHAVYFDPIIILDDGSGDGTYEALRSLQDEGLPLVVLREAGLGQEQNPFMTRLLHMAVEEFRADWVAPLDADEFIETDEIATLADMLRDAGPAPVALAWENFAWPPEEGTEGEPNIVRRLTARLPPRPDSSKVLIPAAAVGADTMMAEGNHCITRGGAIVPARSTDRVHLCHFPIRGVEQFTAKIIRGYLQRVSVPGWDGGYGFQYIEPYRIFLAEGAEGLARRMPTWSRSYAAEHAVAGEPVAAPLNYRGGALGLGLSRQPLLADVLGTAEAMAAGHVRACLARDVETRRADGLRAEIERLLGDLDRAAAEHTALAERLVASARALSEAEQRVSEREKALYEARCRNAVLEDMISSPTFRFLRRAHDALAPAGLTPRTLAAKMRRFRRG